MRLRLGIALACALCACATELQHDLDENSANDTVALLAEHGVAADKVQRGRRGWTVTVPSGARARAWNLVREAGLADRQPPEDTELMPSPAQRRASLAARTATQLEASLEKLPGVVDARVHLNVPAAQRVRIPGVVAARPRASVLLRVQSAQPELAAQASDLVVGGVENMTPEDVRVVTVDAPAHSAAKVELVTLGPLAVAAQSADALRALLGGLAAAVVLLAGAVAALVVRLRRLRAAT